MFHGSLVALITPFLEDGSLDIDSFKELIYWHMEQGTDGIVLCGSTGEGSSLSLEEKDVLLQEAVSIAKGNIPIIMGTSSNVTKQAVEYTKRAKDLGADGCLVVVPYYNKPSFHGCMAHFQAISQCALPIILYHHPGRTGVYLSAEMLVQLCHIPNVIGVKEASGNMDLALEFLHKSQTPFLCGVDELAPSLISMGAKGSISVIANIRPKLWSQCMIAALHGEVEKLQRDYRAIYPLCRAMMLETNPQCVKFAVSLEHRARPFLRLPLMIPSYETQEKIKTAMFP